MASNGKRVGKNISWFESLRHALAGVALLRTERNARFEMVWALLSIILAAVLRLDWSRWVALGVTILLVLAAETVNTAIERAIDTAVGPRYTLLAKQAKDLAAGFVLLMATAAVLGGLWIFGPALLQLL